MLRRSSSLGVPFYRRLDDGRPTVFNVVECVLVESVHLGEVLVQEVAEDFGCCLFRRPCDPLRRYRLRLLGYLICLRENVWFAWVVLATNARDDPIAWAYELRSIVATL